MPVLNWKARQRQLSRARQAARLARCNGPRKLRKPHVPKDRFLRGIEGTGGIINRVAQNLGINWETARSLLDRPDWGDVREALEAEREAGVDEAEECIRDAIRQRLDIGVASANARWLLSKARKFRYGDESKVIHEGGDKPIKTANVNIPLESLDLPLEVKRQILAALDDQETQAKEAAMKETVKALPTKTVASR